MNIRFLVVSAAAPPDSDAESLQVGKILKALSRQPDLQISLATAVPFGARASKLAKAKAFALCDFSNVVCVPSILERWQRAVIRLLSPSLAGTPDWWFLFAWRWRYVVNSLVNKPDIVYARSFPLSSLIAARNIADFYSVPLFLHLSDPWCECPLHTWRESRWHQSQERKCMSVARRISYASQITLERYKSRYPEFAHKMCYDPNMYEPSAVNNDAWSPCQRFRVLHTGNLLVPGRYQYLLELLQSVPKNHPAMGDIDFIHAGHITPLMMRGLEALGISIKIYPWIDISRSVNLQRSADLLISIDNRNFSRPSDDQYLSSKLVDYMAARRPALVVTSLGSANWEFVRQEGTGVAVDKVNIMSAVAALIDYWQAWRQRQRELFELPPPSPAYAADQVGKRLADSARAVVRGDLQNLSS